MRRPRLFIEPLEDRRLPSVALIKDIIPGVGSGYPQELANVNGTLYFTASDRDHGTELWKSDGTEGGTVLVKDIRPGPRSSVPRHLTAVGDRVFFRANYELELEEPTAELWVSDGTDKGTFMLHDFSPGELACIYLDQFTAMNGVLFLNYGWFPSGQFCEKTPDYVDFTLWTSDGTVEGTVPLATVKNLGDMAVVGDVLYFGGYNIPKRADQLWRSDGTPEGTWLVTEYTSDGRITWPDQLTNVNGRLFFVGGWFPTQWLWTSDGTAEGTVRLAELRPGVAQLTALNDLLLFTATDPDLGNELWRSDGTVEGTFVVTDINPGAASARPGGLTNVAGTVYFSADDGEYGRELWRTDGTVEGTWLVRDSVPGGSMVFSTFVHGNGILYFVADDGQHGRELWMSDGSEMGTVLVADINPGSAHAFGTMSSRPWLTAVNDWVFFAANDGANGVELWAVFPSGAPGAGSGGGDAAVRGLPLFLLWPRRRSPFVLPDSPFDDTARADGRS